MEGRVVWCSGQGWPGGSCMELTTRACRDLGRAVRTLPCRSCAAVRTLQGGQPILRTRHDVSPRAAATPPAVAGVRA
jgi:hypothetical protein